MATLNSINFNDNLVTRIGKLCGVLVRKANLNHLVLKMITLLIKLNTAILLLYLEKLRSLLIETALYFSSFPSNISSTSGAFSSVMFVAKVCCPNPGGKKKMLEVKAFSYQKHLSKLFTTQSDIHFYLINIIDIQTLMSLCKCCLICTSILLTFPPPTHTPGNV